MQIGKIIEEETINKIRRNVNSRGCIKSKKINRREPLRTTTEDREALKYSRISLRNFAPSLRFSAVKRLLIQPR